jgi:hypothetical protein
MKYDVAISVAGEEKDLALDLSMHLRRAGYNPYYYGLLEAHGWGEDIKELSRTVYELQSRYCIVFISSAYVSKEHTMYELEVALRRAMWQADYILPLRLDNTVLPNLPVNLIYIDLRTDPDMARVCELVREKLGDPVSKRTLTPVLAQPDGIGYLVVQKGTKTLPIINIGCHFQNGGDDPITLRHLTAQLTDPEGVTIPLNWRLFYHGEPVHMPLQERDLAIFLGAGKSQTKGIQFAPPASIAEFRWLSGLYDFDLMGWVTHQRDRKHPDFTGASSIDVTQQTLDWLGEWETASDARWEWLNDPHNAVGIPATFSSRRSL